MSDGNAIFSGAGYEFVLDDSAISCNKLSLIMLFISIVNLLSLGDTTFLFLNNTFLIKWKVNVLIVSWAIRVTGWPSRRRMIICFNMSSMETENKFFPSAESWAE